MNQVIQELFSALGRLNWPYSLGSNEVSFNQTSLFPMLASLQGLGGSIEAINQNRLRRVTARPFFGWGASGNNRMSIHGNVKTDLTFRFRDLYFYIENKILRPGNKNYRECDIKNSLVQIVEYLNLYDVSAGVLLIFDGSKGKSMDWNSNAEEVLINTLTSSYPMCVVRVRQNHQTRVYFNDTAF